MPRPALSVTGLLRCRIEQARERMRAYDRDRRHQESREQLTVMLRAVRTLREIEARQVSP